MLHYNYLAKLSVDALIFKKLTHQCILSTQGASLILDSSLSICIVLRHIVQLDVIVPVIAIAPEEGGDDQDAENHPHRHPDHHSGDLSPTEVVHVCPVIGDCNAQRNVQQSAVLDVVGVSDAVVERLHTEEINRLEGGVDVGAAGEAK